MPMAFCLSLTARTSGFLKAQVLLHDVLQTTALRRGVLSDSENRMTPMERPAGSRYPSLGIA